ncbi:MAG: glycosyltransferase [Clostridia bacterium]|nr:glycosyltransferase [Clostridia bacterium]
MKTDIEKKIRRYDLTKNVKLLGNISNTGKIYAISDLTINCSIKEGLALTSYESLSMGVPVVSADVGGQKELIDESVGAIVPCLQKEEEIQNFNYSANEINSYVVEIDKILNNLDKYKSNCRNKILQGFTINQMIKNMEKEFEQIVNNPNKTKIENGKKLSNVKDVCKELITKGFITVKDEYQWLCKKVNEQYFGECQENGEGNDSGYDYFKTPIGRLRLKAISITKKMHIYEKIKMLLRKIRN